MMDLMSGAADAGNGAADVIKDGSEATFMADVVEASQKVPVIVDFWAPWCGPCKTLGPMLEKAVTAAKGAVRMVKVNVDEAQMIAAQLQIQSIPTVYAFWQGQPIDGFQGALPGSEIDAFVERVITAAGGAFGAILQDTHINETIKSFFAGAGASGIALLLLGWSIAAVLKVAQGSSTVAMIVGAGMMAAIIGDAKPEYHMVYVATAVGTGSLMGSWMNDSGFWVFTKMGGLTEGESLRSWTPLLMVLSAVGLLVTILLSEFMPMQGGQ